MERYRKKPIVIEAEQWFKVTYDREAGHGYSSEHNPIYHLNVGYFRHPNVSGQEKCKHCGYIIHVHGWIDTLEGGHNVCPGDWIIRGIAGEMYPCKPDIFDKTYDLFKDGENNQQPGDKPNIQGEEDYTGKLGFVGNGTPTKKSSVDNQEKPCGSYADDQEGICDVSSIPDSNIPKEFINDMLYTLRDYKDDKYFVVTNDEYVDMETREILADKECMESIRKSMKQLRMGRGIPLTRLNVDNISSGCLEELEDIENRNPAHYCMGYNCKEYLGHRGWCSDECYNEYYEGMYGD